MDDGAQKRILVVDDEEGIRSLLRSSLEGMGYLVDTAVDGIEALQKWRAGQYCLLITDVVFMYSGGIDLVRSVRRENRDVPILVITAYGKEVGEELLEAGATQILLKPFHLFEIRKLVTQLIG